MARIDARRKLFGRNLFSLIMLSWLGGSCLEKRDVSRWVGWWLAVVWKLGVLDSDDANRLLSGILNLIELFEFDVRMNYSLCWLLDLIERRSVNIDRYKVCQNFWGGKDLKQNCTFRVYAGTNCKHTRKLPLAMQNVVFVDTSRSIFRARKPYETAASRLEKYTYFLSPALAAFVPKGYQRPTHSICRTLAFDPFISHLQIHFVHTQHIH